MFLELSEEFGRHIHGVSRFADELYILLPAEAGLLDKP
jgi:hypothetical protein